MIHLENHTEHHIHLVIALERETENAKGQPLKGPGVILRKADITIPRKALESGDNQTKGTPGVFIIKDPEHEAAFDEAMKDPVHKAWLDAGDLVVKNRTSKPAAKPAPAPAAPPAPGAKPAATAADATEITPKA